MKHTIPAILIACLFAGCGGSGGSTISGKVAFGDGSPLSKGVITLTGDSGSFRAKINADGTYTVEGVAGGDYNVVITGAKEGGETPEMQYDEEGNYIEPENVDEGTPLIDMKYTNSSTSGLKLSVPSDDYSLTVTKPSE